MRIRAVSGWFRAQIRWHSENSILNPCPYFCSGDSLLMNMSRTQKRKLFNAAQPHAIQLVLKAGSHLLWVCRKDNQLLQQQPARPRIVPFSDVSCLNEAIYWCQQQSVNSIWRPSQQPNSSHLRTISHTSIILSHRHTPQIQDRLTHETMYHWDKSLSSEGGLHYLKSWICHLLVECLWKQLP